MITSYWEKQGKYISTNIRRKRGKLENRGQRQEPKRSETLNERLASIRLDLNRRGEQVYKNKDQVKDLLVQGGKNRTVYVTFYHLCNV